MTFLQNNRKPGKKSWKFDNYSHFFIVTHYTAMHISGLFSTPWYRRLATRHVVTSRRFRELTVWRLTNPGNWASIWSAKCIFFGPKKMRFMQIESVLQTKNRSEPAKNRFSCSPGSKPWSFIMSINICPSDWLNVEPDLLSLAGQSISLKLTSPRTWTEGSFLPLWWVLM